MDILVKKEIKFIHTCLINWVATTTKKFIDRIKICNWKYDEKTQLNYCLQDITENKQCLLVKDWNDNIQITANKYNKTIYSGL